MGALDWLSKCPLQGCLTLFTNAACVPSMGHNLVTSVVQVDGRVAVASES